MSISERLRKQGYLVADGATGTELIKAGVLKKGISPEQLLLEKPEAFVKIHKSYYDAGSDYVVANNFGASRTKLEEWNLDARIREINIAAIKCVKKALKESGKNAFVASSVGPSGKLLPPLANVTMPEIIDIYREQAEIICNEGVDLVVFETFTDIRELKAAYIAFREADAKLSLGACLTFDTNGRTLLNNTPEVLAVAFEATDVLFTGVNCSVGPVEITSVIQRMGEYTNKPVIVKPNAGVEGHSDFSPSDYIEQLDQWIAAGGAVFGGCCGSTPEYISAIAGALKGKKLKKKLEYKKGTHLASLSKVVTMGRDLPALMIGERINPTNKKDMIAELAAGGLDAVKDVAKRQVADGADLLDVNIGASGVDQEKLMPKVFSTLSSVFDAPLVVDSTNPVVIEAALRSYGGKALINSTSAEKGKASAVFDLARKYGAAVIGLAMDEKGIPMTAEERLEHATWLKNKAIEKNLSPDNLIIDTLTLSLSSNQKESMETI
ncbi:MAG: homocysteine S-methyltransferase family protein, partial [Oligoflexia bacterium]|nr:homocysteine S-methyltransferase family protein [Oligoflexia bacterium]